MRSCASRRGDRRASRAPRRPAARRRAPPRPPASQPHRPPSSGRRPPRPRRSPSPGRALPWRRCPPRRPSAERARARARPRRSPPGSRDGARRRTTAWIRLPTEVPAGFPILFGGREPRENFFGRRRSTLAGSAGEEIMKHIWLMGMVLTLALSGVASAADSPTFSDEVVRIVQERCQTCHRPGEHAPFSLITYADVFKRRADIRDQIDWRTMPPWKPVPGFGSFLESRRLSDEERATILKWIDADAPEGDRAKLPPPRVFPTGWTLGTPDHVLEMSAPYTVPARAGDVYRCFVVPTSFPEDRWVSKVEYAPSDRKVVHHVLAYIDTGSAAQALHRRAGRAGDSCFWGPGFPPPGGPGRRAPGIGPRAERDRC